MITTKLQCSKAKKLFRSFVVSLKKKVVKGSSLKRKLKVRGKCEGNAEILTRKYGTDLKLTLLQPNSFLRLVSGIVCVLG